MNLSLKLKVSFSFDRGELIHAFGSKGKQIKVKLLMLINQIIGGN